MKLYLKSKHCNYNAVAEYDENLGEIIVLKESIVSTSVSNCEKFRSANSIAKLREHTVRENTVIENVKFRSASMAANFVTGSSTNGMKAWKNEQGVTLKQIIADRESSNEQD